MDKESDPPLHGGSFRRLISLLLCLRFLCFCSSFPRRRESSDFKRSRTKGTGFPPSRE
ncbi:hypothetical protein [Lysobacter gummosus]|uniref:hypothetical protein n=1 Tax=Lysobacter gummosus TaxID=262324 RepID=UPI0036299DDE